MQYEAFNAHMIASGLADASRKSRTYALKRIEEVEGVDLDAEFARDGLVSLHTRLRYTAEDEVAAAPNPSKLQIDPMRLKGQLSWYRSHLNAYIKFLGGAAPVTSVDDAEEVVEAVGITFGLEKDMQKALRHNIEQLEPGLKIIDGGVERKVDAGFIDILAQDSEGTVVVIELKAVVSKPEAVAQILGYMGAIAEEDGLDKIRGYLIAEDHPKRVRWAAKAVQNLELKKYSINFQFNTP